MRVEVFYNRDARVWRPYQFGDRLFKVYGRTLGEDSSLKNMSREKRNEVLCERVFQLLGNNYDGTKPEGFENRSMCVGDVIWLDRCEVYTVAGVGFEECSVEDELDKLPWGTFEDVCGPGVAH